MAYTKTKWVDRQVQRPLTFSMTTNSDDTVTLIPSEGVVLQSGTAICADNMNNIENGIEELDTTTLKLTGGTIDGQLSINGNLDTTGDTAIGSGNLYINQQSEDEGGQIYLVNEKHGTVNIDNIRGMFRIYLYDFNNTYKELTFTREGVLRTGGDAYFGRKVFLNDGGDAERSIEFRNSGTGTYTHNSKLYGGSSTSKTAIGFYDLLNDRSVWVYNDVDNIINSSASININGHITSNEGHVFLGNAKYLYTKDSSGNNILSMGIASSNNAQVYSSFVGGGLYIGSADTPTTYLRGKSIILQGNVTNTGWIKSPKIIGDAYRLRDGLGNEKACISSVNGTVDGVGLLLTGGGLTVVGSGESPSNYVSHYDLAGQSEQLHLTSDNYIYLAVKCNEVAETKRIVINYDYIYPENTKSFSVGHTNYRFANGYFNAVYNSSGAITTSDRNYKNSERVMDDKFNDLFDLVPVKTFKYEDGTSDRTHTGIVAQDLLEAMETLDISTTDFACIVEDKDEEAGTSYYGVRYDEYQMLTASRLKKEIADHNVTKEKLQSLEERFKVLEERLELLSA